MLLLLPNVMIVAQDVQVSYLMLLMVHQQMVTIVQQLLHLYLQVFAQILVVAQVMMVVLMMAVMLHVKMVLNH